MPAPIIATRGLRKRYADTQALAGLDLTVPAGVVCAVLGPNGAGKSTLVRVLATLTRPDAGEARVAGYDVRAAPRQVRARIGLVGQHTAVDEVLGGRENLLLFGRLHRLSPARARTRADELLARFALTDVADRPAGTYSGGTRRRLDLAAALVADPPVLFLDEPTTGLDPRARAGVHDAVRALADAGTTVLLTTQYLEEADRLADTVVVVDHGRVVAEGSPERLRGALGADRVEVLLDHAGDLVTAADAIAAATGVTPRVDPDALRVGLPAADRVGALGAVLAALTAAGVTAVDVTLRRPTLDEVFLHLTADPTAVGR
ncbi:ATP-binding cassette domain-containing protein [Micromonospora siamensis]|uniref:ABC-2 type transport system ATP-binding protein n=1 Tax=Micromonospora siamensis TaxID=299152 RepID=A0A1C5IIQ3_9ACTN|nr:ATP-binding cassette domain-containing protein [Micromonospora siamensis]SCG58227.1 ABC-2 type transport system ATP-binding protein [Micromonospora siamensis]